MIDAPAKKTLFTSKPPEHSRLADAVSDSIAAALFDGTIAPGETLPPEGEIAQEFGVSKPIAREALRQLASAGLVSTQQGKVARAKAMNGEPFEKIYGYAIRSSLKHLQEANEMRRVIEIGIARLACERREPVGLAYIKQALVDMEDNLGDSDAFSDADIRFHMGMAMTTGNSMIRVQMEGMRAIHREVSDLFTRRANRSKSDWQATIGRHRALYEAIASGNASKTEKQVIAHYAATDIASLEVAEELGSGT